MNNINKISDKIYRINIHVKPNSKVQDIKLEPDFLTIQLKSKPIQNKANKELLNLIKKTLKISSSQISIISGHKSSDKILEIAFREDIDEKKLKEALLG